MWQRLLIESVALQDGLFDAVGKDGQLLGFEQLPVLELSQAVPEASWNRTDPRAKEMESADFFEEGLFG